jgi:hypothetical protein
MDPLANLSSKLKHFITEKVKETECCVNEIIMGLLLFYGFKYPYLDCS